MLGSGQLVMENGFKLIYSGDLNLRGGLTSGAADTENSEILIVETTYGSPYYRFPKREEVIKEIKDWVGDALLKGKTPCLLAYSIGKAQELTKYLSKDYTVKTHPAVYSNNRKYEMLGVSLGEYHLFDGEFDGGSVVILPPYASKMEGEGLLKARVTGWAVNRWAHYGVDAAFPLSDHSDFDDLIEYVETVDPQVVYTVHGFCEEFSRELRERGFYSEPVMKKDQLKIDDFI